jgi:hypothetical protein
MIERDLFISHSHADNATAAALAADFEKRGITCWLAPRDIAMGSTYQIEIVRAIEHCRAMLLLFSGSADKSEHILREVELAAEGNKPIYPLRIDHAMPTGGLKYMLANKHWVERQALGDRLAETIGHLLNNAAATSTTERPPPPISVSISVEKGGRARPAIVAGVAVAAVFLVAAGAWFFLYGRAPSVPNVAQIPKRVDAPPQVPQQPEVPPPAKEAPPPKEIPPPKERAEPGPQPAPFSPPTILTSARVDVGRDGPATP